MKMDGSLRQWAALGTVACSCVVNGSCTNTTGGSFSMWLKVYHDYDHTSIFSTVHLSPNSTHTTGIIVDHSILANR